MEERENKASIIHPLVVEKKEPLALVGLTIGGIVIIFLGITTGYLLSNQHQNFLPLVGSGADRVKQVVGTRDKETFRDSAEGTIEKGGIDGEGTHKLIRSGGESQTVYLTSSVVDLDQFIGKKVRVWGETFAAQKAPWLMDVGLVEVLE